ENRPYIAKGLGSLSGIQKGMPVELTKPDYEVGDRVSHIKYGEGTVTQLEIAPRDYKVTIDFDGAGTKIMFATFAKLKMV
ncbi:MAG: ATP-dependent DNA helicase PcrA, partial [Lachnospiraceae bacterium]